MLITGKRFPVEKPSLYILLNLLINIAGNLTVFRRASGTCSVNDYAVHFNNTLITFNDYEINCKLHNNVLFCGDCFVLKLLNYISAFATVDNHILIMRLRDLVGISRHRIRLVYCGSSVVELTRNGIS